jgi:uncharacterized GH25 family protein
MVAATATMISMSSHAHDFWMLPTTFQIEQNAPFAVTLEVGHGETRQPSPIPTRRITRIAALGPQNRMSDLQARIEGREEVRLDDLRFPVAGTYVVLLETDDHAFTRQSMKRFRDYAESEGLVAATQRATALERTHKDVTERYSRCAKTLVRVGAMTADSERHVTAVAGLNLEIVPESDPYAVTRTPRISFRVLSEGRPLAGALVKLTDLSHDAAPRDQRVSDASGRVTFDIPQQGEWQMNVVWTSALAASDDADFSTVFSSLTFGYAQELTANAPAQPIGALRSTPKGR